ncbi:uncharacterized protein LOC131943039 [Physella acuta]|uniref:uncharacterized protein LOC131943039 n=1 Tax=Physella acuta TaxID=109671 RepID=UPI0027DACDD0|nr:uncharacterized protein LOC131943039 [Physella acuta]XP_059159031.1 uncharacterized protein LOC131943039 [Physella acuta]
MASRKSSSKTYESKIFSLSNIPDSYSEEFIKDYVEGVLDVGVSEVEIWPYIPGRALIKLDEDLGDFKKAKKALKHEKLESMEVRLLRVSRLPVVLVKELDVNILSLDFLNMYLELEFANGDEVIQKSSSYPELEIAVVEFCPEHKAVVDKILSKRVHVPLPSENYKIKIFPFYENYHDFIDQKYLGKTT